MASLKKNVEQVLNARGLSRAELGARIGLTETDLVDFLQAPQREARACSRKFLGNSLFPISFCLLKLCRYQPRAFPISVLANRRVPATRAKRCNGWILLRPSNHRRKAQRVQILP